VILFWVPELHRRKGEIFEATGALSDAAKCFEEALQHARSQRATALELRAAICLTRVHQALGADGSAQKTLREIASRVIGGTNTPDLVLARKLGGIAA
jgi:hypothetical protein